MSYLKFDKHQLVNLEYSLKKELLRSNRAGSYSCTTLAWCNTRKYHGLLVSQLDELDGNKHVLLSSLDTTVIQRGAEFNLGIHKFPGDYYEPKGHKYIRDFTYDVTPRTTYRVGGVVLQVERMMVQKKNQVLVKYTLLDAHSPTTLRFKPFLGFRSSHALSKANMEANTTHQKVANGIAMSMYDPYPLLYMQLSKSESEFVSVPDWFYNIEYYKERERGYDYQEDLFVPGYFEVDIQKGESIVFSASLDETDPTDLDALFNSEEQKRGPKDSLRDCLSNAAEQFVVNRKNSTDLIAGYPWYNGNTTQTMVALPGLLQESGVKTLEAILETQMKKLKNGLFPKHWGVGRYIYDSMDASLYFFTTLQKLLRHRSIDDHYIWEKYGDAMKEILYSFKNGTEHGIHMDSSGLICGGDGSVALTWMDADIEGRPVTPRQGYPVEVNALWFNAIFFTLRLAKEHKDQAFVDEWFDYPEMIQNAFLETFWDANRGYLADCLYPDGNKDWSVRPNMVIAVSLPYTPVSREMEKSVLSIAKRELVTPRGLRSLSPKEPNYQGVCEGSQDKRSFAMHNGSVHPWLFGPFVSSYIRVHRRGGVAYIKRLLEDIEQEMTEHCLGTISEVYFGNPPYSPSGAPSQAWSVGAILECLKTIEELELEVMPMQSVIVTGEE